MLLCDGTHKKKTDSQQNTRSKSSQETDREDMDGSFECAGAELRARPVVQNASSHTLIGHTKE
ncbi:hypothetical protein AUF62_02450 [archaeon 13_1_20CM_52_20]|nr:MAG: hypothetical protein AUF62_02450 [archaeon 13_1_20CM_52_20]